MKRSVVILVLFLSIRSSAQLPIASIIQAGIKKVIVAVDLKIQQIQNKTIWLQNAQKTMENTMSKLKLAEINDWVEKQRKQYQDYFQELRTLKLSLGTYHRIKDIINNQLALVRSYKAAWALFRQDKNFSAAELDYMSGVYSGILSESVKGLDQLLLLVTDLKVQMSDAGRMDMINSTASRMEQSFIDLQHFNQQNKLLSIQRSAARGEIEYVKRLYGY
ncbi:MAG: conjugal transfer protein TraI [Chitinophagaceae bacterium]|nr:conjugal transfer protein TraI [Chitinophagaceae bacterium]